MFVKSHAVSISPIQTKRTLAEITKYLITFALCELIQMHKTRNTNYIIRNQIQKYKYYVCINIVLYKYYIVIGRKNWKT